MASVTAKAVSDRDLGQFLHCNEIHLAWWLKNLPLQAFIVTVMGVFVGVDDGFCKFYLGSSNYLRGNKKRKFEKQQETEE